MALLSFLFPKKEQKSAAAAKERLQIIIARESHGSSSPSFLPQLQKELLDVIRKYVNVDPDAIKVSLDRKGNLEVLDVNVVLPDVVEPLGATNNPADSAVKA